MRVYVEGGGDDNYTRTRCREGFVKLFAKLLPGCRQPRVIACGGRASAFDQWCTGIKTNPKAWCVLLVDSEAAIAPGADAWAHVTARDGWRKPRGADTDQLQLMAQCMEAWIIADVEALAAYYGQGFKPGALPRRDDIEQIPKQDLYDGLAKATRAARTKGQYGKGTHGFELIGRVDPQKICARASRAVRLARALAQRLCDNAETGHELETRHRGRARSR